ncbi:hypothetical protein GIB67_020280, partial [Kingdonia uniflora]
GRDMEKGSITVGNTTFICEDAAFVVSKGVFNREDPFRYAVPLLMLQMSLISLVNQACYYCFKPLHQVSIVTEIIVNSSFNSNAGMIFGPTFLGHNKYFSTKVFPIYSKKILDTVSKLGLMFFLFLMGVKMDPGMIKRSGRHAIIIGLSLFFVPLACAVSIALILRRFEPMDKSLAQCLPLIAGSQSMTGFLVIAILLTELKMLNTDLARLAVSSAMVGDVIGITLTAVSLAITQSKSKPLAAIWGILSTIGLVGLIIFVARPIMLWIIKRTPVGQTVKEVHIISIFLVILVSGFISEVVGQHVVLGPLVLGLAVPDGPPLGSALVRKLDSLVTKILFPTYFTVSGIKTNMLAIHLWDLWIIGIIVTFATIVKIAAVMIPAIHFKLPVREAFVLGLILTTKEIVELLVYNLWNDVGMLNEQEFSLTVLSVLFITAIVAPLLTNLNQHSSSSSNSDHIMNAFKNYEMQNQGFVSVQAFMSIADIATMHDDVCNLALDKRVNLVIIPYHKQIAVDGRIGLGSRAIENLNHNIIEKAPCSVGLLVDRSILNGSTSMLLNRSIYSVAVLFMGGADDMEALAYGVRMAKHPRVNLTVIRYLTFHGDNTRDRKLDGDLINEVTYHCAEDGVVFLDKVVKDGEDFVAAIRSIGARYELMMVGRHQRKESKLLFGLTDWNECPELGIIGEMLVSSDSGVMSSVLVA